LVEEIASLLLERPAPKGASLSIDRAMKNGCALLNFIFIYGNFVRWIKGKYTNSNVNDATMFDNLEDLRSIEMPPCYPPVDLDHTQEKFKEGAPTNGNFITNFEHTRQRGLYDNHQSMHGNIDAMTEKFEKEEEKSYHLCFPHFFLYFIPSLMIALLSLIMQKCKLRIIVDSSNTSLEDDTGNAIAQMPTPGVDPCRNPAVYYGNALLRHWYYIWRVRQ
jgi:hypothetical protein